MDEQTMEILARLYALELFLMETIALQYANMHVNPDRLEEVLGDQVERMRNRALFPTNDPAISDVGSDMIARHAQRISNNVASLVRQLGSSPSQSSPTLDEES